MNTESLSEKQKQAFLKGFRNKFPKSRVQNQKSPWFYAGTKIAFEQDSKVRFIAVMVNISNVQLWKGGNKCDISSIKTPRKIWTMLWKSNSWLW